VSVPDLAVIEADKSLLTASVLAACDARGVRVIALVSDAANRRYVGVLGLFDLVPEPATWSDVEGVIAGQFAPERPTPIANGRGTVIAVWGPAGSPGRSAIAITIAAELAAAGKSVVLGDADTHAASIAPSLGLLDEAPGFAAACRLAGADSLNAAELERISQTYGSFRVLTGLGRPTRWPELPADRVLTTIRECRSWAEFTVLDIAASLENDEEISSDLFAPRRNAATLAVLREADIVVAVGSADPVGMSRFLRGYVDLVELAPNARTIVVANKVRASAIGLNPQSQVKQTLARFGGIESPVLVPHDQQAFDAALLSGRTLVEVSPKSAARLAVQELVRSRILVPSALGGKKRLPVSVG
jgi:MinD-like ATPase involved in chromosome partitioning or flagellar assembly